MITSDQTLKIGQGNGHNKESLVDFIRKQRCASFGANESQDLQDEFNDLDNFRVTVAGGAKEGWAEERQRSRSTSIVTINRLENIGQMTRLVSEKVEGPREKLAPDRVLVMSAFRHPVADAVGAEGIAHFALHPDAGPDALRGKRGVNDPVLREYKEAVASTRTWMRCAEHDGLLPILTGDLQLPEDVRKTWSPFQVFVQGMGYKFVAKHIDWIIWHPELKLVPDSVHTQQLFDHVGITLRLQPA